MQFKPVFAAWADWVFCEAWKAACVRLSQSRKALLSFVTDACISLEGREEALRLAQSVPWSDVLFMYMYASHVCSDILETDLKKKRNKTWGFIKCVPLSLFVCSLPLSTQISLTLFYQADFYIDRRTSLMNLFDGRINDSLYFQWRVNCTRGRFHYQLTISQCSRTCVQQPLFDSELLLEWKTFVLQTVLIDPAMGGCF